jgi:hypothetical protein
LTAYFGAPRKWVSLVVRLVFPGVAAHFDKSAKWHKAQGNEPLFGVFWNFCINVTFLDQKRIHCLPHINQKNIVGICALVIYEEPESE